MFEQLKDAFNSISFLSDEDWLLIEPYLKLKRYKKNDLYFKAGDIEQNISFIINGSFKWYYINNIGNEVNFHFFFENTFIVEYQSFLTQQTSDMYIQAMTDSEVILLPKRNKILDLFSKSHN